MFNNPILNTDSYKASHWLQYPEGTNYVYSYIESRGMPSDRPDYELVYFGLQAFIKKYLSVPITREMIDEAEAFFTSHGEPFNREGWEYILLEHKGILPIRIKALAEGTIVKPGIPMLVIENTDPKCFWVTSYIETALLRAIWYPTTVAALSREAKKIIKKYFDLTSDDPEGINFKLHDFGARGVSSNESAALGGMAHLINFMGSDTVAGVLAAKRYYGEPMAAFSIPAAEHSTITSYGRDKEADAYRNMLKNFAKPNSLVAVVSDSYNIYNAVEKIWGEELRQEVIDSGAIVVIRPDSGDPTVVPVDCVKMLGEKFGYTINSKGYKVLNHVRVIQGDGVNLASIEKCLFNLMQAGYSVDNIAFGMGGALLQKVDRDTFKFAMKCSAIEVNGVWQDVYKNPVGDTSKASKKGRMSVFMGKNGMEVVSECHELQDMLRVRYEANKGNVNSHYTTFADVRKRAKVA